MKGDIVEIRKSFARDVCKAGNITSKEIQRAFEIIPREFFLGPGPWKLKTVEGKYFDSESSDARDLYADILVAIDPERYLNNGVPSFFASIVQQVEPMKGDKVLHIGAGVGYYSAILAEVVGPEGHVHGIEIDPALAARAKENLKDHPNVTIENSDAGNLPKNSYDVIVVNAGATHIELRWLKSLRNNGRLILPLTCDTWEAGRMLFVSKLSDLFKAKTVSTVFIYPCIGSRDDAHAQKLRKTVQEQGWEFEGTIRFDPQAADESCWLKDDQYWLSKTV